MALRIEGDSMLAPASVYFKFYTHSAMAQAGLADQYLSWLDKWRENMRMGLTTWGETSNVNATRSDCHAWGASPNIEFLRTVLGINSAAPGFKRVRIEPHPGPLRQVEGEMPHPQGMIKVSCRQLKDKLIATLHLPAGITGTFVWQGKEVQLHDGKHVIELEK